MGLSTNMAMLVLAAAAALQVHSVTAAGATIAWLYYNYLYQLVPTGPGAVGVYTVREVPMGSIPLACIYRSICTVTRSQPAQRVHRGTVAYVVRVHAPRRYTAPCVTRAMCTRHAIAIGEFCTCSRRASRSRALPGYSGTGIAVLTSRVCDRWHVSGCGEAERDSPGHRRYIPS